MKSAVSSGIGKSEEDKVVEKKKQPPPVPARVTACVSFPRYPSNIFVQYDELVVPDMLPAWNSGLFPTETH